MPNLLFLPHADGDMPWLYASCAVFVLKLCVLHRTISVFIICKQTLVCSRGAGDWNKKRKRFAFGKVDLALKSQVYFKGFAFLQTIVS